MRGLLQVNAAEAPCMGLLGDMLMAYPKAACMSMQKQLGQGGQSEDHLEVTAGQVGLCTQA